MRYPVALTYPLGLWTRNDVGIAICYWLDGPGFRALEDKGLSVLHTRADWPWDPPSLLYNGYRHYFQWVKHPRRGVDHSPPTGAEVKERVQLYFYSFLILHGMLRGHFPKKGKKLNCQCSTSYYYTDHLVRRHVSAMLLRLFENRVQRKIFGSKTDEVTRRRRRLHKERINDLYSSLDTARLIKTRTMRWVGHVACIGERKGVYSVWCRCLKERDHLEDKRTWMYNIKMDL